MTGIYVRQSVEKKDSISMESQLEFCKTKLPPQEEYELYKDAGYSGKNTDRPAFCSMMEAVARKEISRIIIYKLDRISRNLLDFANMMQTLEDNGVSLVSYCDPIDTSTPMGRAMLSVTMTFAQLERETIQQRIKDNYYERGRQGFYLSGRAPFGFNKVPAELHGKKTYTFEANTEEAEVVSWVFDIYCNTSISLSKLATMVNEKGMRTYNGNHWTSTTIGMIIRNPVYVKADANVYSYLKSKNAIMNNDVEDFTGSNGCYSYANRKSITKSKFTDLSETYITLGLHEGIVPSRVWLKCQSNMDTNKQVKNSGKGTHTWLSGLMKCPYCGMAVTVVNNHNGKDYINCGGRKLRKCYERKTVYTVDKIESAVENVLLERLGAFVLTEDNEVQENEKSNKLRIELVKIDEEISGMIAKIPVANDILIQYINERVAELHRKRLAINVQIEGIAEQGRRTDTVSANIEEVIAHWPSLSMDRRKEIANAFIDHIEVANEGIHVYMYE